MRVTQPFVRSRIIVAFFGVFFGGLVQINAQAPPPSSSAAPTPAALLNATVGSIRDDARANVLSAAEHLQTVVKQGVVTSANATTAPDGYASRVHASIQDYLNFFSAAINQVEESANGQSLILRLNPLQTGPSRLGLSLTLTKPSVSPLVEHALLDDIRASVVSALEKKQGDLDDATVGVAYSFVTPKCEWTATARCFGRDPDTYRTLFSDLLMAGPQPDVLAENVARRQLQASLLTLLPPEVRKGVGAGKDLLDVPITDYGANAGVAFQLATQWGQIEGRGTLKEQQFFTELGYQAVEDLYDNQPQVSLVGSYHHPARYGGANEWSANVELQFGRYNINRLVRESGGNAATAVQLLKTYQAANETADKFVLVATYKHRGAYAVTTLDIGGSPVTGFTPIDAASYSELSARLQWGMKLKQLVFASRPRVDVTLEGIRTLENTAVTKNRWVGSVTLTMPVNDAISVPLSLTYANKTEYLDQKDRRLSAHLGFSYRLPGL